METVDLQLEAGIARLTLRNEPRRNAISWKMLGELDQALGGIEAHPDARVVLLEAEGDRCFSAGGDIRDWGARSPDLMGREWVRTGNRIFRRLADLDAVVICVLQGDALGGGLELALAADLRLAAPGIQLGFPEVRIGAVPGWLGCARLSALIGHGRARQMVLTGESIEAETGERWGLVNEVVSRERLRSRADELARMLLSRSPAALRTAKRLLNMEIDADRFAPAYEMAATALRGTPDADEGVAAFLEKRTPRYASASEA
jgi:enoyl-CoA hydratase